MIINKQLLDDLTRQAQNSPRLRMAMDLRNTPEDQSQRMLNAIEPGSPIPIHRHPTKDETFILMRGVVRDISAFWKKEELQQGQEHLNSWRNYIDKAAEKVIVEEKTQ